LNTGPPTLPEPDFEVEAETEAPSEIILSNQSGLLDFSQVSILGFNISDKFDIIEFSFRLHLKAIQILSKKLTTIKFFP
jgi:hypothetical protein